jgi:ribonuclease M5
MERACARPLAPPPPRPPPPPRRAACRARFATRAAAASPSSSKAQAPAFARPALRELIVVEGKRDAEAVQQAVTADVAVTHGTPPSADRTLPYAVPPRALEALLAAADSAAGVIIFADPDPGGRAMRGAMDALLSPRVAAVAHAFLPQASCRCRSGPREGDVGVQFARPGAVRAALASPRRRDATRAEFTRDDLTAWGLAGVHGAPPPTGFAATGGVAARRDAVGAALGFGACDGKVFLKYANAYGFTRAEVLAAVAALDDAAAAAAADGGSSAGEDEA